MWRWEMGAGIPCSQSYQLIFILALPSSDFDFILLRHLLCRIISSSTLNVFRRCSSWFLYGYSQNNEPAIYIFKRRRAMHRLCFFFSFCPFSPNSLLSVSHQSPAESLSPLAPLFCAGRWIEYVSNWMWMNKASRPETHIGDTLLTACQLRMTAGAHTRGSARVRVTCRVWSANVRANTNVARCYANAIHLNVGKHQKPFCRQTLRISGWSIAVI